MKNQNSIMPENYVGSISLTLRTRNSKKLSRMLARNWKHQWLPLCPAKSTRRIMRMVIKPITPNQNLRVFWKLVNLQDCAWENHYRTMMKTIFSGKGDNSLLHYNLVHNFIPMPQAMKIPAAKGSSGYILGET